MKFLKGAVAGGLLLALAGAASAKEGADQYPNGSEGWSAGDLPPPGNYFIDYAIHYSGSLKDSHGGNAKLAGSTPTVSASADALRDVEITDLHVLGADYGFSFILPVAHQSATIAELGGNRNETDIGDITLTPVILSWHAANWSWMTALDINAPTGFYDKGGRGSNGFNSSDPRLDIGANYWSFEPVFAATWRNDEGWEVSGKFMLNFKTENSYTQYQSGDEAHVDYLIARHVGPWGFGLAGYYLQQFTPDRQGGRIVTSSDYFGEDGVFSDGREGRVFAFGPSLSYRTDSGQTLAFTWDHETLVENRFGGDRMTLRLVTDF